MSDPAEPSSDRRPASAGSAYLVVPDDGPGHGVLVLHSWWGLTPAVKAIVEALADAGYTAMAPDLLDGALPVDGDEARDVLADSDPNETAALVLSSIVALRAHSADPSGPVAVLGFSMGASWALWVATRQPDSVDAVVAYYGVQNIDFEGVRGKFSFSKEPGYTFQQWVDIPYVTYQLTELNQPLSKTTLIQVPGEPLHVDRIQKPSK